MHSIFSSSYVKDFRFEFLGLENSQIPMHLDKELPPDGRFMIFVSFRVMGWLREWVFNRKQ